MHYSGMTSSEITKLVERYIGTDQGYLNHFSYCSHERFYSVYCGLDIDVVSRRKECGTTKRTFVHILQAASPADQAKIIRGVFAFIPPPEVVEGEADQRRLALREELLGVAARLEADRAVTVPPGLGTTETVQQALRDAEVLLAHRGPQYAVDRAHTALHGYLKQVCAERGVAFQPTASVTEIFGSLRREVPAFRDAVSHDAEAKRVVGSLAAALDSLNTIRNRATLAHPNELLLEAPEAMLYLNLARALIAYVGSKLPL